MAPTDKRLQANRFAPLDSHLGTQHTAKGMTQDIYESENSLPSSKEYSTVKYSLEVSLQVGAAARWRQGMPATPIGVAHDKVGTSLNIPKKLIKTDTFPYASLPSELRQIVLRELTPKKSIWNGTSFLKSCPKKHQRDYFKKPKYIQNRALPSSSSSSVPHWARGTTTCFPGR
jgi:hypothetical protein